MLAQVQPEETHEPKDYRDGNGGKEKFGVVEEGQGVVAQEGYNEVVNQGGKVKGVAQG